MSKEISSSKQKISKMPVYMPGGSWRWFGSNIKDPRFGNPDFKIPKDRQVTTKEIAELVSYQGLGDSLEYVNANKIEEKELAKKWRAALTALKAVHKHLYPQCYHNQ
jgi:hypothetical protein